MKKENSRSKSDKTFAATAWTRNLYELYKRSRKENIAVIFISQTKENQVAQI